jgi:hypothetical protein
MTRIPTSIEDVPNSVEVKLDMKSIKINKSWNMKKTDL